MTAFLAGVLIASLPCLALVVTGDPQRLLLMEWTRAAILKNAQAVGAGPLEAVRSWTAPAGGLLSLALLAAAPLVLLHSLAASARSQPRSDKTRPLLCLLVSLTGCLLFTQYAIEPKINRLLQVGPPLFCCLFYLAHSLGTRWLPRVLQWLPSLLLLGLTGAYVGFESGQGSIDSPAVLLQPQEEVRTARGVFNAPPRVAQGLKGSLAWIERNVERGLFYASPALALHYFLADKRNPAPVTDFSYLLQNESVQQWVWERLQQEKPVCYLYRPGFIQGFDPEQEAPLLFQNLKLAFPRYQALPAGHGVFLRN